MQICQSLIGGKPVKSNLPIIEKRYPATGEVIAHIEPASNAMLDEAGALKSVNIWVNSYNLLPPGLPFGGAKHSGFGRENSAYTLDDYSEIKSIYIQL